MLWIYNTCQKSLGNFEEIMKNYSLLSIQSLRLLHTPFPTKQCWSVPETLGVIVHEKLFRYCMYFSQKPTLFTGRGDECAVQIKNLQSAPGLLASIVPTNSDKQNKFERVYFLMKFLGALCWVNSEPSSNSRRHGNTGEIKELKKEASPQTEPDEQQLNTFWSILFNKKLSI